MANRQVVPFHAEHLLQIQYRDEGRLETIATAAVKEMCGPAFTAIVDDEIIACAGVVIAWPGVGAAWAVLSPAVEKHGLWITRSVRRMLDVIIRGSNLHRLEMVVLADNERNYRWAHTLGFHLEDCGLALKYTAKQSAVFRFERITR